MSGWSRTSNSLGFRGGLALFHTPCGLVRMLRRFNTSDHTASRFTTRVAPEQQTVAIISSQEMSRNGLPGKISPLRLDFDCLPRCMLAGDGSSASIRLSQSGGDLHRHWPVSLHYISYLLQLAHFSNPSSFTHEISRTI